jgi:Domain of unknown function (DUF4349)
MTWTVRGRAGLVVPVVLLAFAAAAGCTDGDGGDSEAISDTAGAGGEARDEASADAAGAEGDGGGGGEAAVPLAVDTVAVARARDVVHTGTMELTVEDVDASATDVRRLAADAGGFVADEQVRARDEEVDLTVRVPADRFDGVRGAIAELGDVAEQKVEARDVTAEVVDVESRIASLRASVVRVRGLLAQSGDVVQLALVEGELARREVELEALLGQQRVLRDQVDLATLTVHMSEDAVPSPSDDAPGFADGLRRGWVAAVDGGRIALAVAGFVLPFAVPLALVAWASAVGNAVGPPRPRPTEARHGAGRLIVASAAPSAALRRPRRWRPCLRGRGRSSRRTRGSRSRSGSPWHRRPRPGAWRRTPPPRRAAGRIRR